MGQIGQGILGPGQSDHFGVVLTGGTTYNVYVRPSEPGVDFDLFIYDENGNQVAYDTRTESDAYCRVRPRWTGPFRIEVKAHRGLSTYTIVVAD